MPLYKYDKYIYTAPLSINKKYVKHNKIKIKGQ